MERARKWARKKVVPWEREARAGRGGGAVGQEAGWCEWCGAPRHLLLRRMLPEQWMCLGIVRLPLAE